MSLTEYERKRRFDRTPEPKPVIPKVQDDHFFVVQKHRASHLHYDFRLESRGLLKSWAIPKGPTMDPEEKRLAIMVEDHPIGYANFEGVIPEGNYGAGTVMVWDKGKYSLGGGKKSVEEGLKKGEMTLYLEGEKLNGEFALVRLKDEKNWMFFRKKDRTHSQDFLAHDRSVITGLSMDEISENASEKGAFWISEDITGELADAPAKEMPDFIAPMLSTSVENPFDKEGWLFELKWDGYRAIGVKKGDRVRLWSRNRNDLSRKFPEAREALENLNHDVIVDGEVAVVDDAGKPAFQLLQNYDTSPQGHLVYYVFDLLFVDGRDIRLLPLVKRKEILRKIIRDSDHLKYSDHILGEGINFFEEVKGEGLEGIVAKDIQSIYESRRSKSWLKIKTVHTQDAVIGGFTEPRGSRKHLGALILGVYEGDEFVYIGHAGGGSDEKKLRSLRDKLEPLVVTKSPFKNKIKVNSPVKWVKPELVCEVSFREWTGEGSLRQPILVGTRDDKNPREVEKETVETTPEQNAPKSRKEKDIFLDGQRIRLTNLDKVFWPKEGFTKGDLIDYYLQISDYLLPHLMDRPQSLHRYPDGIFGEEFYQKNVADIAPAWAEILPVRSEGEDRTVHYLLCQNKETLLYLINLGCIDLNPWSSRKKTLSNPDYLIIDLDPEDIDFKAVIETALAVKEVLDKAKVPSFLKTSGATGIHILVPLKPIYTYDQVKDFGQIIALLAHQKTSRFSSLERSPKNRQKKVYIDYLQNAMGQTIASVYSVRPKEGGPVSMPIPWSKVDDSLSPLNFNIKNVPGLLKERGDLLAQMGHLSADIDNALKLLA